MKPANVLRIESLDEDWRDKDVILLHASFQLLHDCVEQEKLFENWGTKGDPTGAKQKRQLRTLYRWWLKRRKRKNEDFLGRSGARRYQRDNEQLIKLIHLRRRLWT